MGDMRVLASSSTLIRLAGVLLLALGVWFQLTALPGVSQVRERLEHLAYDARLRASLPARPQPHPDILIAAIDERSLAEVGRWPWPRARLAELVRRLTEAGAAVVVLDSLFSEPETGERQRLGPLLEDPKLPETVRQRLGELLGGDGDEALAGALSEVDSVLGFILHRQADQDAGALPPGLSFRIQGPQGVLPVPELPGLTGNVPVISAATPYQGFLTVIPDEDGIIRRVPLLLRHHDRLYPALALEAVRALLLIEEPVIETAGLADGISITGLRIGELPVPTDGQGRMLVPYRGGPGSFARLSAARILKGDFDPAWIEGRIVLVGATALALPDLRPTPVASVFPGVEVHASLIAGILDGGIPYQPDWAQGANLSLILAAGLFFVLAGPALGALQLGVFTATLLALLFGGNLYLWRAEGLALSIATPALVILTLFGWFALAGFARTARHERQLQQRFGQYVPPQLVRRMAQDPDHYRDEGETREMTVLFADICGFTGLSERLSAHELRQLLNRFFTPMTRIIFETGGTIDKYVGDMIMAFWNAPLDDPDHARHAVEAALSMVEEAHRLSDTFTREGLPALRIGVGINTGPMHVGDMGSEYRRAYTVLGDNVNLGSRLEGLTRLYGLDIVVGENTVAATPEIRYRQLDRVRVKGREQPLDIFAPLGPEEPEAFLRIWDEALAAYQAGDWHAALEHLDELVANEGEKPLYRLYQDRIRKLQAAPPDAGWDGVFTLTSK